MISYRKRGGDWAKPKAVRTPPREGQAAYDLASDTDREVLQLLLSMPGANLGYYSAYSGSPCAVLRGPVGVIALQQAASTGATAHAGLELARGCARAGQRAVWRG